MNASINTANIALDIKPLQLFADERVYRLDRAQRFAYIALQAYAVTLNATTASEYVDGEFSLSEALARVRDLTEADVDAMVNVGLLSQVDGDRFCVAFTSAQTAHETHQKRADGYARQGESHRLASAAQRTAQRAREDTNERRRERDAERQRRKRERDRATESAVEVRDTETDEELTDAELETLHAEVIAAYTADERLGDESQPRCVVPGCSFWRVEGSRYCVPHRREYDAVGEESCAATP